MAFTFSFPFGSVVTVTRSHVCQTNSSPSTSDHCKIKSQLSGRGRATQAFPWTLSANFISYLQNSTLQVPCLWIGRLTVWKWICYLKKSADSAQCPPTFQRRPSQRQGGKSQKIELFWKVKNLYRSTNVKAILSKKSRLEKSQCLVSGYTAEPQ